MADLIRRPWRTFRMFSNKLKLVVDVMRYPAILTLLCLGLAGIFLHPDAFEWTTALLALVVMILLYSSVFLYNYFTDMEEDRINDKYNPALNDTYRRVLAAYIPVASAGALAVSLQYLGTIAFAVTVYCLVVGFAYSAPPFRLKRLFLVKNLSIAGAMAPVLFIMAGSLTGTVALLDVVVAAYFSAFSFLGSTISDLRDMEGDSEAGVRTIPVVLGVRGAGHVFLALSVAQVLVIAVPVALGLISEIYLLLLVAIPSRFRLTYRVYNLDLERIDEEPEVPGLVLATLGAFATALISGGFVG